MSRILCRIIAIILCGVASSASADEGENEGGVPIPDFRGRGDVVPLHDDNLTLTSERLEIVLSQGAWHASAEYRLANPGPARRVEFGIPTGWHAETLRYEGDEDAKLGAEEVKASIAGKTHRCAFRSETVAWGPGEPQVDVGLWCVFQVQVPHGDDIVLSAEFWGSSGGNIWVNFNAIYLLNPGGRWKGTAQNVSVELRSQFGVPNISWPPNTRIEGNRVMWKGSAVEWGALRSLVVDYTERKGWDGGWARSTASYNVKASSELAPQGAHNYSPANAIQGDLTKAWCEGVTGEGVGEWLQVDTRMDRALDEETCEVRDLWIVPGYARNAAVFAANGRVATARVEACDDAAQGMDISLTSEVSEGLRVFKSVRPRPLVIPLPAGPLRALPNCIRFVIRSTEKGKTPDTCVSTLIPRVYCRKR